MKKFLVLLLLLLCSIHLFCETRIDLSKMALSLDDCLKTAEEMSYSAVLTKLKKEALTIDVVKDWFVYLPSVEYLVTNESFIYDIGEENEDPIPPFYEEDSEEGRLNLIHKIKFKQRLFDSSTIDTIMKSVNYDLNRDVIVQEFIAGIRYLVRELYFDTMISMEKQVYYKELLDNYTFETDTGGSVNQLLKIDNNNTYYQLQKSILALEKRISDNKRTLLLTMRKSVLKDLTLTTQLSDLVVDKEQDIQAAILNNINLKSIAMRKREAKKDCVEAYLNYLPEMDLQVDSVLDNKIKLGGNFSFHGKNIQADLIGEYLIFDQNYYYLNDRANNKIKDQDYTNFNDYDLSRFNLTLVGKLDLDTIINNGFTIKQLKDEVVKVEISEMQEKDKIADSMITQLQAIEEKRRVIEILHNEVKDISRKIAIIKEFEIKEQWEHVFEFLKYNEDLNKTFLDKIYQLYSNKYELYRYYASYYQKVDGKVVGY